MNKKCVGCGITLQDSDVNMDGYVSNNDFSLCERCFRIKHYNENKVVVNRNYFNLFDLISDNDIVVYVSSLLTLELDYIDKFKNVILVLTKRDIFPKSVKDNKIISYVKKRCNVMDVIIVSSNKNYNLDMLFNRLNNIGNDKRIYFVGYTNSGKSSLINRLSILYGNEKSLITTSAFPNTTMDVMKIRINNLVLYDTPGIVNDNSILNILSNNDLKCINSKKEIKPITFQIKGSGSIAVNDLFRIDYETDESSLTFYLSNSLDVRSISTKNELLINAKYNQYNNICKKDIVISDIGFIKITNSVNMKIRYVDMIDIKIRDNMI